MKELIKLESINVWAGPLGIMNCDDSGLPILEESKSWDTIEPEWFQHLSNEDKDLVNTIINNNKNNKD
jgi:hypothetical protein